MTATPQSVAERFRSQSRNGKREGPEARARCTVCSTPMDPVLTACGFEMHLCCEFPDGG